MVNLITEKTVIKPTLSPYLQTYVTPPVQEEPKVTPIQEPVPPVEISDKANSKNKLLLPLSLIGSGGILLYLGLKNPNPTKMYKRFVDGKLFEMDKRLRTFTACVKTRLNKVSSEATQYIEDYKARRFINPADNLGPLRSLTDPRQLIDAQDIAFESLVATSRSNKLGATEFGDFSVTVRRLGREARRDLSREQDIVKLELGDYVQVPIPKNEKYSYLVEVSENRLIGMVNFLSEQTGRIVDEQTSAVTKRLFVQMADAVLESKKRIRTSKMNIIDETYARMSKLLGIRDLKPTYHKIPEAADFATLTEKQLKPLKLPSKLRKAAQSNVYLRALQTKDFANLSEADIKEIFYSAHYENNLLDLGFLIDRFRLRQAVDKFNVPDKPSQYDVIIPKLEYLSKRLHEFGKRELLDVINKDFDHMRQDNRQAAVYYILRVAKRIGFESIQEMDEALMKENTVYANLNIRNYIRIFKENPDLYFS